jgi:hypothetical protein
MRASRQLREPGSSRSRDAQDRELRLRSALGRIREMRASLSKILDLGQADPFSRVCVLVREALIRDAALEQQYFKDEDRPTKSTTRRAESGDDLPAAGELFLARDLGEWIPSEAAELSHARRAFRDVWGNWYHASDEYLTWRRVRSQPAQPAAERRGRVWEPSQGSHRKRIPRGGAT